MAGLYNPYLEALDQLERERFESIEPQPYPVPPPPQKQVTVEPTVMTTPVTTPAPSYQAPYPSYDEPLPQLPTTSKESTDYLKKARDVEGRQGWHDLASTIGMGLDLLLTKGKNNQRIREMRDKIVSGEEGRANRYRELADASRRSQLQDYQTKVAALTDRRSATKSALELEGLRRANSPITPEARQRLLNMGYTEDQLFNVKTMGQFDQLAASQIETGQKIDVASTMLEAKAQNEKAAEEQRQEGRVELQTLKGQQATDLAQLRADLKTKFQAAGSGSGGAQQRDALISQWIEATGGDPQDATARASAAAVLGSGKEARSRVAQAVIGRGRQDAADARASHQAGKETNKDVIALRKELDPQIALERSFQALESGVGKVEQGRFMKLMAASKVPGGKLILSKEDQLLLSQMEQLKSKFMKELSGASVGEGEVRRIETGMGLAWDQGPDALRNFIRTELAELRRKQNSILDSYDPSVVETYRGRQGGASGGGPKAAPQSSTRSVVGRKDNPDGTVTVTYSDGTTRTGRPRQ